MNALIVVMLIVILCLSMVGSDSDQEKQYSNEEDYSEYC